MFTVNMSDFIDIALVIIAKNSDRDVLDFYLSLCPEKLKEEDFQNFLHEKEFIVAGYENLSNDMEELKEVLKEIDQWV